MLIYFSELRQRLLAGCVVVLGSLMPKRRQVHFDVHVLSRREASHGNEQKSYMLDSFRVAHMAGIWKAISCNNDPRYETDWLSLRHQASRKRHLLKA